MIQAYSLKHCRHIKLTLSFLSKSVNIIALTDTLKV